jgi:cell division protein FtsL
MNQYSVVIVLIVGILISGVGIVHTKYQARRLFVELQVLQEDRDDLEIEWELLQLEESTLATESVVDQVARTRLDMIVPDPNLNVYISR